MARIRLAESADDARDGPVVAAAPVAIALSGEQVPAAERAERHSSIVRMQPDGPAPATNMSLNVYSAESPGGQGVVAVRSGCGTRLDEHEKIIRLCERAVQHIAELVPGAEVGCLLRVGESLRHVAHAGRLRVIYEVAREQGGVVWRAADHGEIQLVEDVRSDPDYLASDERIRSEIAAPVHSAGSVVAVIDVEFPERVFDGAEAERVAAEAAALGRELEAYAS